ncbi:MAG: ZIP family metal transporter [Candidatus Lloydbacteria bacterium CG22_combo_CG10-13_8_21_14_all_47_15]|uniref:ZIP family metal transporter n=1 Tax=Candidatus Lloydbacteria bacterium CG22_combo_CG10-13_8_21_14_all_47_15 TaxID=1974635 RepID=A0A2H0CV31_9BACT|nr:MAG: ZIP family metal transporter [Candidatus Lloydbacteria bacterium CG22_combo_CG10-13_8_21_14_all_47_15]
MTAYLYAFGSVFAVSLVSLIGLFALSSRTRFFAALVPILVALAVGGLLGDAFIHLIPEAFKTSVNETATALYIIGGMLVFFTLEKFLHWHHSHANEEIAHYYEKENCEPHRRAHPLGKLVLISDGVHNLLDGIIIGGSFMVSIEVGFATTMAVLLHEIPQEIGDFGILVHAGFSRVKALFLNFLSALLAVIGVGLALFVGGASESFIGIITPLTAGGFIYIAAADLIPELHKTKKVALSFAQFFAVVIGIALMALLVFFE